jgi:hypothetical protein
MERDGKMIEREGRECDATVEVANTAINLGSSLDVADWGLRGTSQNKIETISKV